MHHQAAHSGVYFHASELALPTGCWKGAKEHHLACHISSLATASQEEGLKLNGNENKIQLSDLCHCPPPTVQPTLLSQADTELPGREPLVALRAGNSADPQSSIRLYSSLSIEGASGISGVPQHPSYPQSKRCVLPSITVQSMTFRALDVPSPQCFLAPDQVLRSESVLIFD